MITSDWEMVNFPSKPVTKPNSRCPFGPAPFQQMLQKMFREKVHSILID